MKLKKLYVIIFIGVNLMNVLLFFFFMKPIKSEEYQDFTFQNIELRVPGEPGDENAETEMSWKCHSYRYLIKDNYSDENLNKTKGHADYKFKIQSSLNVTEVFIGKRRKNIWIAGYINILDDAGNVIQKIYLQQKSNSTFRRNLDYYLLILRSIKYKGKKIFRDSELDKINEQIPNSYMQNDKFFFIFLFGLFNLLFIPLILITTISGSPPKDLLSSGIIPIIHESMDIYFRKRGKTRSTRGYVILTNDSIMIYLFRKLRLTVPKKSQDWDIQIFKEKYIQIQNRNEKNWIQLFPDDIDRWKEFIK